MVQTTFRLPPGYRQLTALNREVHARLGLSPVSHHWCRRLNAVHLNAAEFASAATAYPVVFSHDSNSGEFSPVAVLGLRSNENLFVNDTGEWLAHCYQPAYVRRYPFYVAEMPDAQGRAPQRLVCFDEGGLIAGGSLLFDANGKTTPVWEGIQRLLEAIESSRQQTRVLCKRLESLGLFTPFEAIAMPRSGKRMRLQGLFRVDEEKLNAISGKDLRVMLRKGELRATYAHLVSLENFSKLMELAVVRDQATARSAPV